MALGCSLGWFGEGGNVQLLEECEHFNVSQNIKSYSFESCG